MKSILSICVITVFSLGLFAACGGGAKTTGKIDAGDIPDADVTIDAAEADAAEVIDAGVVADAAVDAFVPEFDAGPETPGAPTQEVGSGGGKVSGGGFTFEVQIGHPISQKKASGGNFQIEGGAAVNK